MHIAVNFRIFLFISCTTVIIITIIIIVVPIFITAVQYSVDVYEEKFLSVFFSRIGTRRNTFYIKSFPEKKNSI